MDPSFSKQFDVQAALQGGKRPVQFGTNVLAGLIEGIDEFRRDLEQQRRSRSLGPAMLGAFLWVDDAELLRRIADFPSACVVVSKQPRGKYHAERLRKVADAVKDAAGLPAWALSELEELRFHQGGKAPLLGPGSPQEYIRLPALRTLGYRKAGDHLVPILHTKMMLLGELWWHDEDGMGGVADVTGFTPHRLWLGSANGTGSSRRSLEFGLWLEDPGLLNAARRFLVEVLAHSQELDPDSDVLEPDLVVPDYDDEAMWEAMAALADYDADEHDSEGDA
ncbi:hypothetical protein TK78_34155 [Streptomyces sp. Tue 6075]|uniref:hypothetical protein n=1 Tax=Streptomyces sp. Tue 6075 TaxID=1661694 RepID=UPI00094A74A9|nr:hypothetical protein [Streptomyces sp. Tue 6075]APS17505.1 hypothetical protein TK78_00020 [Streptomyces sp. Tue 6075]APS23384.1 hypothetical protein TK78_34155 [Streptomyces sp. Tue 6075]